MFGMLKSWKLVIFESVLGFLDLEAEKL
jgi:hypothetical protein